MGNVYCINCGISSRWRLTCLASGTPCQAHYEEQVRSACPQMVTIALYKVQMMPGLRRHMFLSSHLLRSATMPRRQHNMGATFSTLAIASRASTKPCYTTASIPTVRMLVNQRLCRSPSCSAAPSCSYALRLTLETRDCRDLGGAHALSTSPAVTKSSFSLRGSCNRPSHQGTRPASVSHSLAMK